MRRLRAVERVAPGALGRMIEALALPPERAAKLRANPAFTVFETGGLAKRGAVARLRKRLISLQLDSRVDHRSGAYATAKSAALRAVAGELERSAAHLPDSPAT